ncbi:hypothetical protein VNO78_13254 [Psophocarpus tetragonolobus]|uniref:Peptidase A1 domain-containing protein n=1 Tax=Psophocarpus tetragonolobus TaxID=3891 RepID=A0AAN9SS34_PSOTE
MNTRRHVNVLPLYPLNLYFLNMHPFVLFSLALCSLSFISSGEANESVRGFTIDLIHWDSILSPFYNPSLTPSERIINAALRSISRLNRVALLDENKLSESLLIPDSGEYLMRFSIGTPPVEKLAIADTGGHLSWIQCSPCRSCVPQDTPLFEPNKSSTFTNLSCDSQPCTFLGPNQQKCGTVNECIYLQEYGDKSFTTGVLGTETFTFDSSSGTQSVSFPNTIFGCGFYNHFSHRPSDKAAGLVGLGAGPLSLVSQLGDQIGHKFSYCLLPFSSNSTSKLKLGSEANITGNNVVSTPLIMKPSSPYFYFLNLEAITIGQNTLQTGQTDGNIIIDSGSTLTLLEETLYYNFEASLEEALGVESVQDVPFPFSYCFPYRENMTLPSIAFQFTGATVTLDPVNLFVQDNDTLCLAVVPSSVIGFPISIFGNIAQIEYQVEYDLEGKKVSFAPADCTKF